MSGRTLASLGLVFLFGTGVAVAVLQTFGDGDDVAGDAIKATGSPASTADEQLAPTSDVARADDASREQPGSAAVPVLVNGAALSAEQLGAIESTYGVRPLPGHYWYDAMSGLYGVVGRPSAGFMLPGHELGALAPDASSGDTGVFLNGRHVPAAEVAVFSAIWGAQVMPARYWMDGNGNVGYEGTPVAIGNLYVKMRSSGGGGGGDNFWNTRFSAGNSNAGNTQGYVSVPGHGPVGYGFD